VNGAPANDGRVPSSFRAVPWYYDGDGKCDGPATSDEPVVPPSRRLFLKGTGLAVGAAWAPTVLLSFASPATAASTTAFVDTGPVTNRTHSAVVTKPDRGAFVVTEKLVMRFNSAWSLSHCR